VRGVAGVYAAGDIADFPVKHGGLAAEMADAAAEDIAARAGADLVPAPFAPVLRGTLLTGSGERHHLRGGPHESTASERLLWWPPAKVAARYLAPVLAQRSGEALRDVETRTGGLSVHHQLT
jgi:sulfide:quinone oxidoreductase